MNSPPQAGQPEGVPNVDSGLACLAMLAKFFDKPADYDQLRHALGDPVCAAGEVDLLRHAKAIGFKASAIASEWARLARTPLPCIARAKDCGWFILAKVAADETGGGKCLIQDPRIGRPEELTREQLEERWDNRLILVATRAQLAAMGSTFDLTWFIPAVVKYRKLFGEVLIASFFLQLFGLISPLFFQVVVDKVLVHRAPDAAVLLDFHSCLPAMPCARPGCQDRGNLAPRQRLAL